MISKIRNYHNQSLKFGPVDKNKLYSRNITYFYNSKSKITNYKI